MNLILVQNDKKYSFGIIIIIIIIIIIVIIFKISAPLLLLLIPVTPPLLADVLRQQGLLNMKY